jgi:hypothetical protein
MNTSEVIIVASISAATSLLTILATNAMQLLKWNSGEKKKTHAETIKAEGDGAVQYFNAMGVAIDNNKDLFAENSRLRSLYSAAQTATAQSQADKLVLEQQYKTRLERLENTVDRLQIDIDDFRTWTEALVAEINRLNGNVPPFVRRNRQPMQFDGV